jgi:hypothetical protein
MRRPLLTMVMVASVLDAAPARAQGWRWLEKLSGPGDFTGYEVSLKIWCQYQSAKDGSGNPIAAVGISLPCLVKKPADREMRNWLSPSEVVVEDERGNKRTIDLAHRNYAIGVSASYLRGRNDLPYEPTVDHIDRTVQVVPVEAFVDFRLRDRTDVGLAVGPNFFLVRAADDFVRWSVEPRLTIKLFDLRKGNDNLYAGTASLRIGLLTFFREFTARDFGAIGNYRSGTETGPSVRFIFDFDRNPFTTR